MGTRVAVGTHTRSRRLVTPKVRGKGASPGGVIACVPRAASAVLAETSALSQIVSDLPFVVVVSRSRTFCVENNLWHQLNFLVRVGGR